MINCTKIARIYAFLLCVGGLFGYLQKGSTASLFASGACAIPFFFAAYGMKKGVKAAYNVALFCFIFLFFFFSYRFITSWKLLPGGVFAVITVLFITQFLIGMKRELLRKNS